MEQLESEFKEFTDGLQKQYTDESEKKEAALKKIKDGGLGMMKSVQAYNNKKKQDL